MALPLDCLCLFGPVSLSSLVPHADCVAGGCRRSWREQETKHCPSPQGRQTVLEYLSKWVSVIVRRGLKKDRGC